MKVTLASLNSLMGGGRLWGRRRFKGGVCPGGLSYWADVRGVFPGGRCRAFLETTEHFEDRRFHSSQTGPPNHRRPLKTTAELDIQLRNKNFAH